MREARTLTAVVEVYVTDPPGECPTPGGSQNRSVFRSRRRFVDERNEIVVGNERDEVVVFVEVDAVLGVLELVAFDVSALYEGAIHVCRYSIRPHQAYAARRLQPLAASQHNSGAVTGTRIDSTTDGHRCTKRISVSPPSV